MKIKSLLAAVSMVAITAGSAHALVIGAPTGNSTQALACELDLTATPVTGLYGFNITRNGGVAFNTGVNTITIMLPNGRTFASDATALSINSTGTGTGGSVGNVTAGGTAGASSITFTIDITNAGDDTLVVPQLPIAAGADVSGSLTVNVVANGAPTDGGPASNADMTSSGGVFTAGIFTGCVNAITVSGTGFGVASDEATNDTQVALGTAATRYQTLSGGNTLGSINASLTSPAPFIQFVNAMGAAAPLQFAATDVTNASITVTPSRSTAGLASATIAGVTRTASGGGFPYSTSAAAAIATLLDGTADNIDVTAATGTAAAPILSQSVNVTASSFGLNQTSSARADFIASVAGGTGGLDTLDRVGASFGVFDWNGASGTNSVYRVTGLPAGTTTGTINFTNDSAGNNGVFPFSITSNNGEGVLQSFGAFTTTNSDYRRADIGISFEVDPATTNIDVDRLMSRGGVVTDFGGGANNTGAAQVSGTSDD